MTAPTTPAAQLRAALRQHSRTLLTLAQRGPEMTAAKMARATKAHEKAERQLHAAIRLVCDTGIAWGIDHAPALQVSSRMKDSDARHVRATEEARWRREAIDEITGLAEPVRDEAAASVNGGEGEGGDDEPASPGVEANPPPGVLAPYTLPPLPAARPTILQ
jgi:hypothetical protein